PRAWGVLNAAAISRHCCARRRYSSALLATIHSPVRAVDDERGQRHSVQSLWNIFASVRGLAAIGRSKAIASHAETARSAHAAQAGAVVRLGTCRSFRGLPEEAHREAAAAQDAAGGLGTLRPFRAI